MAPSNLASLSWGLPVAAPLISSSHTFRPRPRPRTAPPPAPAPALRAASSHQCVAEANETSRGPVPVLASILVAGACAAAFAITHIPQLGAAYAAEGASDNKSTTIFQRSCAGCHAGGGNILQPNATLFAKDLDRNGMANVDDVFQITYFGKGRMPGYGEKCTPRGQCTFGPRLSDADIRALAEFVRLQADQGWPS